MNIIATWLCLDDKEEESSYTQVGSKSSSKSFQDVYYRCVFVFFEYNVKINPDYKYFLFMNKKVDSYILNGIDIIKHIKEIGVEIINIDFTYKLPIGYYGSWRNQLFEFNIIQWVCQNMKDEDIFMLLDSDCLIVDNLDQYFQECSKSGLISYIIDYDENYEINGISRKDMKEIYEELLQKKIDEIPLYHAGELLFATVTTLKKIINGFDELFNELIERFKKNKKKFNEEAHILSFLFYKNGFSGGGGQKIIKRLWNTFRFYNINPEEDKKLPIWHLPSEKKTGYNYLFRNFKHIQKLTDERKRILFYKKFLKKKNILYLGLMSLIDKIKKILGLL